MPLCDTMLLCAEQKELFRPLWSDEILVELRRTLEKFGRSASQIERRLQFMRDAFPESCVPVVPSLLESVSQIPDSGDRHVVAAAMLANAHAIVTFNLRHFPRRVLQPLGISVFSPDEFLVRLFHRNPLRMLEILDAQACQIRQTKNTVLDRLKTGLPEFVALVGGRQG
jgi:predicted nucleic acid-binding protein